MKKHIIIIGTALTLLSVLILGFNNRNYNIKNDLTDVSKIAKFEPLALENQIIEGPIFKVIPNLYYGVDTRFVAVKKSDIDRATTLYDFLNEGEKEQIVSLNSVDIIIIKDNQQSKLREYGKTDQLTDAQIKLIRSLDYFNHFIIRTEFKGKDEKTGRIEERFFGPHITVVPELQASYVDGKEALISYLKDNSRNDMWVITDNKLGPIKISFLITKEGTVTDVKHDAMTTGYPSIDEKMITLIKNIPGKWTPAKNAKGEKMEQELVFTFGPADGC